MALIQNASSLLDKAKNTIYGVAAETAKKGVVGGVYKLGKDVAKGYSTPGGLIGDQNANSSPANNPQDIGGQVAGASTGSGAMNGPSKQGFLDNTKTVGGGSGSSLGQKATTAKSSKSNSVSSQQAQNIAQKNADKQAKEAVGQSWNTSDGYIGDSKTALDSLNGMSSNLGTTRDAMLGAYDRQYAKTNDAIAGNKELIARNQKNDMRNLGEDLRKSIFNSNIALGAASGSSAAEATAKALQDAAGKNRQATLTNYGDQISAEDQKTQNATDTHDLMRKQAYEWEDKQKADLINEFNIQKGVYDRLLTQVPDWKKADVQAMSENNLNKLISGLGGISTQARNYRDYLNNQTTLANQGAQQIEAQNINIDKPAALDTPEFTDKLNLPDSGQVDTNATDFYNPKNTGKKRYGSDIFGNALTFEEAMAAQDPTQA